MSIEEASLCTPAKEEMRRNWRWCEACDREVKADDAHEIEEVLTFRNPRGLCEMRFVTRKPGYVCKECFARSEVVK